MSSDESIMSRFLELIGWLTIPGRRPGMIGRAVALSSAAEDPELVREDDHWIYQPGEAHRVLSAGDILELVATGQFEPRFVHVEPDLAGLLFQHAVGEAERSVGKLHEASRVVEEIRQPVEEHERIMPFVFASTALDRAVQASISAIILSVAAGEAQVNRWAVDLGGWSEEEDRKPLTRKPKVLAERKGVELDLGRTPLQELKATIDTRNDLVHSKPIPSLLPATGDRAAIPGRSISVEARQSCHRVREALVATARELRWELPGFLAYCPPGDPSDDDVWRGAVVMTGVREDPDFPPRSSGPAHDD